MQPVVMTHFSSFVLNAIIAVYALALRYNYIIFLNFQGGYVKCIRNFQKQSLQVLWQYQ